MAIYWMLLAGILAAISNLCMKQHVSNKGSSLAYLVFQLIFSFLVLTLLHPVRTGLYYWNAFIVMMGMLTGVLLGFFKWTVIKALEKGPSGLTFAVVNSASVIPAVVLVWLFGTLVAFPYTFWHYVGSLLVISGLLWAGWAESKKAGKKVWFGLAASAFVLHVCFLVLTQCRAFLIKGGPLSHYFDFACPNTFDSEWFTPAVFAAAAGLHGLLFGFCEQRLPVKEEISWGSLGGIFTGACAFFFTKATEVANAQESVLIFPIFSITLIIACNLWGRCLYQEKVNWLANSLCVVGILVEAM